MLTSSSNSIGKTTDSVTDGKPVAEEGQEPGRSRAVILAAEVGGQRDQAVVLTPGRWGIGSAYSNQIVIDQETVAPRHAMIIVTEHRVLMTSWANATYVNEECCRESLLCAGDVLTLGTIDLELRAADPSELISQLPDVGSQTDRSATIQPVPGAETLRRLDDLDTALGLLEEELGGSEESADQLNELIAQIESDITRRSSDRAGLTDSDDQPAEAFGESSVSEFSETEPTNAAANHWNGDERSGETSQPHDLDDLMGAVVPDAAAEAQWATHQDDAHAINDVAAEFSEDDTESETDEFAELVGSTSVLAQNLTLNALRSRAEAVRQLDEMILAAAGSKKLSEAQAVSESRTVDSAGSAATGDSNTSFAESEFEPEADDFQSEGVSDDWDAEAASDESLVADEVHSENALSDESEETDWDTSEETAASDTVEFSAMDTVNEAGSLLSSLFREEVAPVEAVSELTVREEVSKPGEETAASDALTFAADEQEPDETDATWDKTETQPATDSKQEFSWEASANEELSLTAAPAHETPEAAETSEDVAGVRSRLAEMFDMPALASATPQSFEREEASASDAGSIDDLPGTTTEPKSDLFAANEDVGPAAPQTSGMQLTSWLDGMKSSDSSSDADSGDAVASEEDANESVATVADDLEPSADEASIEATPSEDVTGGEAEDSVAAYMRDLLARNRARHGQPERPEDYVVMPSQPESEVADEDESVIGQETADETILSAADADADTEGDVADQQSWLSQEPKHQLDKDRMRADTQALREVANETARCAVTRATRQKLKLQVAVKTTASVVMLGCGVTASLLGVSTLFAALVMGVGAYFAFDLGLTIVRNWKCITA